MMGAELRMGGGSGICAQALGKMELLLLITAQIL